MRPRLRWGAGCSALALVVAAISARASETQTYTYDALGRLTAVDYTGSVNNGQKHSLCFDPSSNRTKYRSDSAGAPATCPTPTPAPTPAPTPTPTPPPANHAPVAANDSVSVKICETKTINLAANDIDLDNDHLVVSSIGSTPYASIYRISDSTFEIGGVSTGAQSVVYQVTDGRGGTDTALLNITVQTGLGCQ